MNTQEQVIQYLESHNAATVNQLSEALGLTKADIRYHVNKLVKRCQVEMLPDFFQGGAGRPAVNFRLTTTTNSRLLLMIIQSLMNGLDLIHLTSNDKDILADCIARSFLTNLKLNRPPAVRLSLVLSELEPYGFILRWEARSEGPLIKIQKELISSIVQDNDFSSRILNSLVSQIQENRQDNQAVPTRD